VGRFGPHAVKWRARFFKKVLILRGCGIKGHPLVKLPLSARVFAEAFKLVGNIVVVVYEVPSLVKIARVRVRRGRLIFSTFRFSLLPFSVGIFVFKSWVIAYNLISE